MYKNPTEKVKSLDSFNAVHLKLDLIKYRLSIVPWNNLIRVVVMRYDTIKLIKLQFMVKLIYFYGIRL